MIKLYPEQLQEHLNKKLYVLYLIFGNDPLLTQESLIEIRQAAKKKGFEEYFSFQINNAINWQEIFSLCQSISLFSARLILHLFLPEINQNLSIYKNMMKVIDLIHKNILLIVQGNSLKEIKKNAIWIEKFSNSSVLVMCQTPERKYLPHWIMARAKKNKLNLDKDACQLLCHYYEGNLLALSQILNHLTLSHQQERLTSHVIRKIVNDFSHFTPIHLIDSLLMSQSHRAIHILQQLRLGDNDLLILLCILQRKLLLLLTLKNQLKYSPLSVLFNKYSVWKNRRPMIQEALNRLKEDQLHQALKLLAYMKCLLCKNEKKSIWSELEKLVFVVCHKTIESVFLND